MKNYTPGSLLEEPVVDIFGDVIGYIVGDKFIKYLTASKHMLRNPRGWATDREVLISLRQKGIQEVVIIDRTERKLYTAPLSSHWENGTHVDRGHGLQLVLPLKYWVVTKA